MPLHSINFISCYDGFTLHDLVSYNGKHNEANGENNREYFTGEELPGRGLRDISWHGYRLDEPLWFDYGAQFLVYTLAGLTGDEEDVHVILNMSERTVDAPLPQIPGRKWHLALDTSRTGPDDILPRNQQSIFEGSSYLIARRTVAVFEARG
ncbi:hypothetical protein [Methylomicrobium lacus]|uniref:hypothetical protein n=1 Tax=Methylomicrobium lacus TaxID=136992 RepID=UPI00045EA7D3|nr:hypothetical protein [Methylomicrobium lacus]